MARIHEGCQKKARIRSRINQLRLGHFGNFCLVGEGIQELKIDFGPGYRIYLARVGATTILLLGGGDKSTQSSDIERAVKFFNDYKRRVSKDG